MKTTGLEEEEDIELIREMKRKARADLRKWMWRSGPFPPICKKKWKVEVGDEIDLRKLEESSLHFCPRMNHEYHLTSRKCSQLSTLLSTPFKFLLEDFEELKLWRQKRGQETRSFEAYFTPIPKGTVSQVEFVNRSAGSSFMLVYLINERTRTRFLVRLVKRTNTNNAPVRLFMFVNVQICSFNYVRSHSFVRLHSFVYVRIYIDIAGCYQIELLHLDFKIPTITPESLSHSKDPSDNPLNF
ncbi:hypothetical protein LXL04_029622 [Taraxacum kok-saghyz]